MSAGASMWSFRGVIIYNSYQGGSLNSLAGPRCDGKNVEKWLTASLGVDHTTDPAVRITIHQDQDGGKMQNIIESLAKKLGYLPAGERKPLVCSIATLSRLLCLSPLEYSPLPTFSGFREHRLCLG